MPVEIVDIYDDSLRSKGSMDRDAAHKTGELHKTIHCWFADGRFVYFQIRGRDAAFPDLLDVTVGGHVAGGESVEHAIQREAKEEVGVELKFSDLHYMGRNRFTFSNGIDFIREFSEVYFHMVKKGFNAFAPNAMELSGIAAIPFREGHEVLTGSRSSMTVDVLRAAAGRMKRETTSITAASFVPGAQDYYARVVELGELFVGGIDDLAL